MKTISLILCLMISSFALTIPPLETAQPAAGHRVKHTPPGLGYDSTTVYSSLYLPTGWTAGQKYPVIAEFPPNSFTGYSGNVDSIEIGYGLTKGTDYIWIGLPFLDSLGANNQTTWWGNGAATSNIKTTRDYVLAAIADIIANYGADSTRITLAGFSRGSIATGRIGCADDTIATKWNGFFNFAYCDGQPYTSTNYPTRVRRIGLVRPSYLCVGDTDAAASISSVSGHVDTLLKIKSIYEWTKIIGYGHSTKWLLQDTGAQQERARAWLRGLSKYPTTTGTKATATRYANVTLAGNASYDAADHFPLTFNLAKLDSAWWANILGPGDIQVYDGDTRLVRTITQFDKSKKQGMLTADCPISSNANRTYTIYANIGAGEVNDTNVFANSGCWAAYDFSEEMNHFRNLARTPYNGKATSVEAYRDTGKIGFAARFNGTNSSVLTDTMTEMIGVSKITVSILMSWDTVTKSQTILSQNTSTTQRVGMSSVSDTMYYWAGAGTALSGKFKMPTHSNGEYFIASYVFDGTADSSVRRLKAYINGAQKTLTFNGTVGTATSSTARRNLLSSTSNGLDGKFNIARFWNVALTAGQVLLQYDNLMRNDTVFTYSASENTCVGASITADPSNATVTLPSTATYTVTATGDAPLSYQWKRNDTAIVGATSSSYTTPATTQAMSGNTYRCIVSNSCGADTSARAKLYVITPGLYFVRDDGTAASKTTARGPGSDTARCMSVTVFNASSFPFGDSVYFYDDGGVFDSIIVPPSAGITIKAGPGEHPIISGSNNEETPSYDRNQGIFLQVDSVTVDGFEVRYCGQDNVWCGYTTKGTRLRNLNSHHSQYDGYKGVNTASFSMFKCRGRLNLDDGSSLHDSASCIIDSSHLDSNGTDGAHNVQATSCTITGTRCKGNAVGVHIGGHSAATVFRCSLNTNTSAGCFAYDTAVVVLDSCPVSGGEYGFHAQSYGVLTVKYCSFANHTYYGYWHEYGNSKQWLLNNTFRSCGNAAVIVSEAMKLRAYRNRFYCDGFDFRANAEFNLAANIHDTSTLFAIKNASIKPGNLVENCYINNCDNVSLWGDTDTAWTVRNCIFRSPDGDNFYGVSKVTFDHCVSDGNDLPDTLSNTKNAAIDSFVVSTDPADTNYAKPKTLAIGTGASVSSENFTKYYNGFTVGALVNRGANGISSSSTAKKIFFFFNRRK